MPVANFGSWLGMPLFFIGFLFHSELMIQLGIIFFSFAVLFGLITLPVEFNASSRAIAILRGGDYLTPKRFPRPARC